MEDTPDLGNEKWLFFAVFFRLFSTRGNHSLRGKYFVVYLFQPADHPTHESGTKSGTAENQAFRGRRSQTKVWQVVSLLRVPVLSSDLLGIWSCHHCPQDCGPATLATSCAITSPCVSRSDPLPLRQISPAMSSERARDRTTASYQYPRHWPCESNAAPPDEKHRSCS